MGAGSQVSLSGIHLATPICPAGVLLRESGFNSLVRDPLLRYLLGILREPLLWSGIGLVVGLYLFYLGFDLLQRRRLIMNTPRSTVRAAALGPVEASGTATGPYTLISPLAEQECFYYRATAWEKVNPGIISSPIGFLCLLFGISVPLRKKAEETLCAPFFVDDGTGQLLVNPRGAELELTPAVSDDYDDSLLDSSPVPGNVQNFLARRNALGVPGLKVEEYCIRPGDKLFVLGTLRETPMARRRGGPDEPQPVLPGSLSPEAADLQRRGLESVEVPGLELPRFDSQQSAAQTRKFNLWPRAVLMKGSTGNPFFISRRSQREVVETLGWKSFVYVWGGPALALAFLWILLERLGVL